jgi:uncharacterized OsmC-like protein
MEQTVINGVVNGVDVDRMTETMKAINTNPGLATFQFRASNRWITGGHNRTTIQEFYGAGQEDSTRRKPFVLDADEPPVLLSEDRAATPVEYVLHALAACLTTSLVYHAAARRIKIEEVESKLEGDLDLRGFLGLSSDVRKGYQNIRVSFKVKSDAPADTLRDLCQYSAVFDIVSNPVPVSVTVKTVQPS